MATPARAPALDPVGLSWLVTVRWTTVAAGLGAVIAGSRTLDTPPALWAGALLAALVLTNLWLMWQVRGGRQPTQAAGALISVDVLALTWLLWRSGGVLNPASVYYLVQIVVVALVLGRRWTLVVTVLCVVGYATLFAAQPDELAAAQVMHPEIGQHMQGMWLAFALTAIVIGILVVRLATAVERRDRALLAFAERESRAARVASLATLAAGAAHELSSPLSTIAVASHELERSLTGGGARAEWQRDAALIRRETARCREILDAMSGGSGEMAGEVPQPLALSAVIAEATARLSPADRSRVTVRLARDGDVVWPRRVVGRALSNLLQNAAHASPDGPISVDGEIGAAEVRIVVSDRGAGMSPETLARAGEPFFTTKPAGVGTGLGLFVTRSSVEQLGGSVSLTSTPGAGTSVTVVLPLDVVRGAAKPNHG